METMNRVGLGLIALAWAAILLPWERCQSSCHDRVLPALGVHECHDGDDHCHEERDCHGDHDRDGREHDSHHQSIGFVVVVVPGKLELAAPPAPAPLDYEVAAAPAGRCATAPLAFYDGVPRHTTVLLL